MSREVALDAGAYSFYGAMKLTVISGTANVHGATLQPGFSDLVFFPFHGLPWTFFSDAPFVLGIEEIPRDYFASTELAFYYPSQPIPDFEEIFPNLFFSRTFAVKYPDDCLAKVEEIVSGAPSTIFCAGGVHTGKSTFSRLVANYVISNHGKVYYVDLDSGQPEMALPSLLSLTVVERFILRPPEHEPLTQSAQHWFFAGDISVSKVTFYQALPKLLDLIPPGSWVVINSNGYIVHPGIVLQKDFITLFKPDHIFLLHKADKPPEPLDETQINVPIEKITPFKPIADSRITRELRITTYFLRGRPPVSTQQPIPVPLREIRVGVATEEYYDPLQMPALLSGSVVMLCIDDRVFPPPQKVLTIVKSIPAVRCKGIGIVRAVDMDKGVLWIVTPVPMDGVNFVVVSVLPTPEVFLTDCPRCRTTYIAFPIPKPDPRPPPPDET